MIRIRGGVYNQKNCRTMMGPVIRIDSYYHMFVIILYTRYSVVAYVLGLAAAVQPLGRVRARAKVYCI